MINSKSAIGIALAGAFVLGASVIGYSTAQQSAPASQSTAQPKAAQSRAPSEDVNTSFSELQEDEIGQLVRAYLLENPEVIIEAVNEYQRRQIEAEQQTALNGARDNLRLLIDADTAFVGGKNTDNASVALIEFYDYHCGYCKKAAGIVNDIARKDGDIKVVLRELPILREESGYAAEMSLASIPQGKFMDFHMAMMEASGTLSRDRVRSIAKKQGLDLDAMDAEIRKGEVLDKIGINQQLAAQMGLGGTPIFIVASLNGEYIDVINGFSPEAIEAAIDEAKIAAKKS